ncbi:MAG: PKD domain-containing protein [Bacteroidia bacterium]
MLSKKYQKANHNYCGRTIFVLLRLVFSFVFIAERSSAQNAVAAFSVAGSSSGCAPLNIQFINNSSNASSYSWDFGNGNTSALPNPTIVYVNPGNYSVKLVAYGSNGSKDSLIKNNFITVIQNPVADFSANLTGVCINNPISFTNLSQNFDSCVWDFGDGLTSNGINPVHTYTASGQFSVTLVVYKSSFGCSDTKTKNHYITIYPKPVSNFTANLTSTCNLSQVFSFTSSSNSATMWSWDFGDGTTANSQNSNHTYTAPGTYNVKLITSNSSGCIDTLVKNNFISVLNNPQPQISVDDSTACIPANVHFLTGSATSYLWNFGDGTQSTLQNPYHPYPVVGTYTISVSVIYSNGCSASSTFNSLNLSPSPTPNYTITNSSGCAPLTVSFVNTTSVGNNSFLWSFGDGATSTQISPVHTYIQPGSYPNSLTVTNASGCSVTVPSTPVIVINSDASFTADATSGCPPLTVNFTSLSAVGGNQYNWNFGDGASSTQAHPTHTYTSNGSFNVSLTITFNNGCVNTYILPVPINLNSTQSSFVTPTPVTACAPFTINLSDNSSGTVSWNWNFGDGTTSSIQNTSHTYTIPGTYTISLLTHANGNNCDQFIPDYSTLIINGGGANFSYITELCPPYIATFHDSSTNAVSWLWNFGDGTSSTLQHPTHTYANPGTYSASLTITTADGCTSTSTHSYAANFSPLFAIPTVATSDTVPPLNVQFNANSQGATQWFWDFGDGTTSSLENPSHTFTLPPPYNISLIISNDSCSDTLNFPNVELGAGGVILPPDTLVIHQPDPETGCAPLSINFHNPKQNAIFWLWSFGDGATSTQSNPIHIYTDPGVYDLTLITSTSTGIVDTIYHPAAVLVSGITADFSITHTNGCFGNSVDLIDNSLNAANWQWDFGDGTTSVLANPSHVYTNINNSHIISLKVTDSSGCSDFLSESSYGIPLHAVSSDKKRACQSDTVFFFSSNLNYSNYQWSFGDGTFSSFANPAHVFSDTGSYSVSLTVYDTSGCQQVFNLPDLIEIDNPVANFTSINTFTNCFGIYFTFTNTSQNSSSWLWDFGNGVTSTDTNAGRYYYYQYPGYYTVSLTSYEKNCSSTFTQTNLIYVPAKNADFNFIKNSDCLPGTINFTDQSTDAAIWHWDFGDSTSSTQQNPVHIYTSKPTGPVLLTINDIYGCPDTISKIVIDPPEAGISLTNSEGCNPLHASFSDSSHYAVSWLWNFGDGGTDTTANPVHTFQSIGYYNVQLIITSTAGCVDTIYADSLVHVAGPVAGFSSSIQDDCSPAIVDFTNNSLNSEMYSWNFGDSSYSIVQNPSHIYSTPGNYSVTLTAIDSLGCSDTLQMTSLVNVRGPVASFSISGVGGCLPYSVQFTNASTNSSDWFWSFGDGDSSAVSSPVHEYSNPGNYVVSLITRDSTGCESFFTYPDTIHVYSKPTASFSISDSTGCSSLNVSFTNLSSNGSSCLWNFGDGSTSSQNTPSHTYTAPGTYQLSLITTSQGGCSDTLNYPNTVKVYVAPAANFSANVTDGCAPLNVGFMNLSTGTQNAAYFWDFGNGFTSTQENPFMVFNTAGTYTVRLTVTNAGMCSDVKTKAAYIKVYDGVPPAIAQIMDVTVVSNSTVNITWKNVADPDLYQYALFRLNRHTGSYDNIYTIVDTNSAGFNVTTTYTDAGLATLDSVYTYKVQTTDHCGNRIDLSNVIPHTTMNVTATSLNKNIAVNWTPYIGCNINEYEIYRADPGGSFNLLASVPPGSNSFVDSTVACPVGYFYKIRATGLCATTYFSFSDTSAAIPESDLTRQFIDVVFSTVMNDMNVLTEWNPPEIAPEKVARYDIYRSSDKVNYELAGSVPNTELKFIDEKTDVHRQNYYYKIIIINECDVTMTQGRIGSSILLSLDYNESDEIVKLRWTKYEGWKTGVEKYVIEKKNGNGSWETFTTVDGQTLETDDK